MAEVLTKQRQFFIDQLKNEDNSSGVDASRVEKTLCCFIPCFKIGKDKLIFGTEIKNLQLKTDKLWVRIGGGFDDF